MKAKVELVIRNEDGNILSQLDPYWIELGSQSLHDIWRGDEEATMQTR